MTGWWLVLPTCHSDPQWNHLIGCFFLGFQLLTQCQCWNKEKYLTSFIFFSFNKNDYTVLDAWQVVKSLQGYTVYLDIYIEIKIFSIFFSLLRHLILLLKEEKSTCHTDKQLNVLMISVINVLKPSFFEYCDKIFTEIPNVQQVVDRPVLQ